MALYRVIADHVETVLAEAAELTPLVQRVTDRRRDRALRGCRGF
jgi:hypothetical protein